MKKLLLILLYLPMIVFGQQTYVPDDNFKNYLEANGMGNGIPNDDYVTTANINTVTLLTPSMNWMTDLTGIEDFLLLETLNVEQNQLTSLDVSNNIALTTLICPENQFTNLDVSNNTTLIRLNCRGNDITSLDLSNNVSLTQLECNDCMLLTHLDVSNNTALEYLDCSGCNDLTCLDVSQNTVLTELNCAYGSLEQLNTKNGNWANMVVSATHNDLMCVEVDNVGYATNNWSFDSFTTISTNCNYTNPCNTTSAIEEHSTNKELLRTIDLLGRETKNKPLFYIYDDGTVEKRITIE